MGIRVMGVRRRFSQPRLGAGDSRNPTHTAIEDRIWEEIDFQAEKFSCSRSWVIATMLADYLGLPLDAKFRFDQKRETPWSSTPKESKKKKRGGKRG